jgi:hypothetical protein
MPTTSGVKDVIASQPMDRWIAMAKAARKK